MMSIGVGASSLGRHSYLMRVLIDAFDNDAANHGAGDGGVAESLAA